MCTGYRIAHRMEYHLYRDPKVSHQLEQPSPVQYPVNPLIPRNNNQQESSPPFPEQHLCTRPPLSAISSNPASSQPEKSPRRSSEVRGWMSCSGTGCAPSATVQTSISVSYASPSFALLFPKLERITQTICNIHKLRKI